jgi:hypothetical protein
VTQPNTREASERTPSAKRARNRYASLFEWADNYDGVRAGTRQLALALLVDDPMCATKIG